MNEAIATKIREARRSLIQRGVRDTMDNVLELTGGSKSTLKKYWPATYPADHPAPTAEAEMAQHAEAALDTAPPPALLEARARYQAALESYQNINRHVSPLKSQIDPLKTRQAALTAEYATVTNLERYRVVKAELLDIEDQLVILERQYAPLSTQAEARWPEVSRLRAACEALRQRALKVLDHARVQHFAVVQQQFGAQPRELQRAVAALTELVGEDDVAQYVTSMTWQNEIPQHVPPWDSAFWVEAS